MTEPVVEATYYTDPFCPWCWAAEGARRRLELEYDVRLTVVIAGLREEIDDAWAREEARHAVDAAAASGMPVDARVWLEDPPRSTYPAGVAFHAAADPAAFLRGVREAVYTRREPMDDLPMGPPAALERFRQDLARARAVPEEHRGPAGRVRLPTLNVGDAWATGAWAWEAWRAAAARGGAPRRAVELPDPQAAVRRFGSIATAEVVTVTGLPIEHAAADLWRLAADGRVTARRVPGGELWSPAG